MPELGRCGVILQARMGSSRLPGKVMRPLAGRPMIERIVHRLQGARRPDVIVLATSSAPGEAPLVAWAQRRGVAVFRGDERDVLDRYLCCARAHGLDTVVRATGDNPFVDASCLDGLLDLFAHSPGRYACAFPEHGSGLPIGVGVEVMTVGALEESWAEGHEPHHREHVDEYILEHRDRFGFAVYQAPSALAAPDLTLTVDTFADFERAERIWRDYSSEHDDDDVPVAWAIAWLRRNGAAP